ncbi:MULTISPECIES: CaiB/BaiF CoA transferase family protein [Paraburkholderia]|uniref:Crotonobetainyl-CoA:carnitine CoA-transferase CaiB n=1 Tax=Paraburkholderia tropica TaxID=92647 RepID=A0A1A5X3X0_9BURK|nr:CaiB/BaiF CoA-transferase family protein [Paraburkholderia tropica]MBB2980716.1 crotonobetainyl-CoA:carnitine CoA-transferase CaiB-like acyl-CoA transferase [Paraburkholderia tropica]MBB3003388.1 crotonobetainyl-CoA:carnitine CoA-transferase CaiB-like acyl-CoA transferase [Paraburkholderia tropica]MBB6322404.1 crotonobetainyl-CoA:carnitine CoA-transferase CaiB-like acyl-CoA transferase [Paraburkholderia tropica]MDE1140089.1 CaiB/BaiF CoA-transferase family protein [Paraburkholderia tropica]
MHNSALPLADITVVSIEQAIAAPLASRHLADWGARVIKIERPGAGDFARGYDTAMDGLSSQFVWTNRSKESLALDIKDEQGQETLEALLARADVFIQNLAPGAAKRQGLDAKSLVERFPRLIACDISGYGSGGPYSSKKAYDLLVQCETGFLSINGTPETPSKCGLAIADIATGMYTLNGILMGLHQRARTGRGMAFEVSLFDAMTEWMSYPAYYTRGRGEPVPRSGARHATIAPYGPFAAGDGKTVFFGVQNEREWRSFCEVVLGDASVATDPRYVTNSLRLANRDALERGITERFAAWTSDEVLARLDRAAIANGKMNDVEALLEHPQLVERDRYRSVDTERGAMDMFLPAVTIAGVEPVMGPVPAVGEHTESILAELAERAAQRSEA